MVSFHAKLARLSSLVLVLGLLAVSARGQEDEQGQRRIKLEVGRSKVVRADWPVTRVSVADSEIADVQVLSPNEVLVVGKSIGVTDLVLWNEQGKTWEAVIDVELDLRQFERELKDYFPTATLSLSKSSDVVVVRGTLRRIEDGEHLVKVLKNVFNDEAGKKFVNLTSVAGVQQVLIKVKVAEASRDAVRSFGIDWALSENNSVFRSSPGGQFAGSNFSPGGPGGLDITLPSSTSLAGLFTIGKTEFAALVDAMVDNNYVRILAEPSLVALSGEEASFLAGGEFPIPVPQSGGAGAGGGSTAITIEYKEFGVRLSFRPTVLGDGKIRLKIAPEVSELSDVGALAVPGTSSTVPAIRTRRAETTVEMNSGQTFAMAGLLQNRVNASASKIPGMGQLPVIGALFRSVRYERNETELLVLATVELVEPLSIDQDRPVPGDQHIEPSDWELYSQGRLHGERKAPVSPSQSQTLKEMGLDDLRGPGAWDRHDLPPAPSRAVRTRPGTPVNGAASGTDTTETEEGHD